MESPSRPGAPAKGWWVVAGRVTRGLLAVTAALLGLLWSAPPAAALEPQEITGSLFLDGLANTTPVGAQVPFIASLTNDGPGVAVGIRILISISLAGAGPQEIRVERRELDGTWATIGTKIGTKGQVKLVDDSTSDLWLVAGGTLAGRYRLTLLPRVQPGDAVVVAEAQHRVGRDWQTLARTSQYLTRVIVTAPPPGGSDPAGGQNAGSAVSPITPFTPAPTLLDSAPPIVIEPGADGGAAGSAQDSQYPVLPWLFSSRLGLGLCLVGVLVMLAVAAWLLRREVSRRGWRNRQHPFP